MYDNRVQSRDTSAPVYMQSDGTATSEHSESLGTSDRLQAWNESEATERDVYDILYFAGFTKILTRFNFGGNSTKIAD
jgi:hypothetical protein